MFLPHYPLPRQQILTVLRSKLKDAITSQAVARMNEITYGLREVSADGWLLKMMLSVTEAKINNDPILGGHSASQLAILFQANLRRP